MGKLRCFVVLSSFNFTCHLPTGKLRCSVKKAQPALTNVLTLANSVLHTQALACELVTANGAGRAVNSASQPSA
eukprot:1158132-Pelagomonas_calceolata.AAC.4